MVEIEKHAYFHLISYNTDFPRLALFASNSDLLNALSAGVFFKATRKLLYVVKLVDYVCFVMTMLRFILYTCITLFPSVPYPYEPTPRARWSAVQSIQLNFPPIT